MLSYCPHYGAQGKVKSVSPRSVVFIVKNKGDNFKPGQELEKTHDQMKKIDESLNENRDFEKLYNLFTKKDYFNLKNSIKQMLRNYDVALKKGDKGAQKYTKQDVIKSVTAQNKENAKRVYDELVTAIKKKDIRRLKSRLRYDQPYSLAIFNQITGKKLPKTNSGILSFLDNEFMKESVNEMSAKSKKIISKLGKKEKEMFSTMVDMMGFDQVMADYKRDKKAFKQALADMSENINEDGHTDVASAKRKAMLVVDDANKLLNKLNGMNKEDSLPSWLSDKITIAQTNLSKSSDYLNNPVESVNEFRDKREADTARDQIGNKALYMIGAKDFVFGTSGGKKSLVFKIMRNSKGVSHIRIRLSSMDLYDIEFLAIRAGKIKVKSKEKGVYGDQLGVMIKKNTGLNIRL